MIIKQILQMGVVLGITLVLLGCGGEDSFSSTSTSSATKYDIEYKGLSFYNEELPLQSYKLTSLTDTEFNALSDESKLIVANKLLSTLYFGYPIDELKEKINSQSFISDIQIALTIDSTDTDKVWLEAEILNEDKFLRIDDADEGWAIQEAVDILARFYSAKTLDKYFFNHWVSSILTQTIMFSPAYELDSSHNPNIARVYNRIFSLLEDDAGMRYITYMHMISEDNWRRFRSPEDNGREMMEIFTFDFEDAHVPIAGKALQNWKLDRDHDTLVIGLNENTEPLNLFGTTVINGDDFYRELAKSNAFTTGVVKRLVSFFFTDYTESQAQGVINSIVSSKPETWQDILKQIVFSKEYLLNSSRVSSGEELFFSLTRKMNYKHRASTFHYLRTSLTRMNQATMKYKLGRLTRVPLDTLSFAYNHSEFRRNILLNYSQPEDVDKYYVTDRAGWSDLFLDSLSVSYDAEDEEGSLESLIHHIFETVVSRKATVDELKMFTDYMVNLDNGQVVRTVDPKFDMFDSDGAVLLYGRKVITLIILDYVSRLEDMYLQKEVN